MLIQCKTHHTQITFFVLGIFLGILIRGALSLHVLELLLCSKPKLVTGSGIG